MQEKRINWLDRGTKKQNEELGQDFWNEKWELCETGWDIGYPSPAIEEYLKQYENKNAKILIPGCGNTYEAEFLLKNDFQDVTILNIAPKAVEILKEKFKEYSNIKILCENFFDHTDKYDLIIEQTFFCALSPHLRENYAKKSYDLLKENGKIAGLLFNTFFEKQGPPFGGSTAEYEQIFKRHFEIHKMEPCYNSIKPRENTEVFIILKKKRSSL